MNIYLASKSPRRSEILKILIPEFTVIDSGIDEELDMSISLESALMALAFKKAKSVLDVVKTKEKQGENSIIIAADTVVYPDRLFLKPVDKDDAYNMLRTLSDKKHEVYTSFCVLSTDEKIKIVDVVKTDVYFRELDDEEIQRYIMTDEPYDKAGAYAIQGYAASFIEKIDGDFYAVMGLPVCKLQTVLKSIGVSVGG